MLRDLFERPSPVIHLDAAIARDVRPGDVVFIGLPSDWHPEMIRQVQEFADAAASTAVEHKYVLPKLAANVLTFQGLKSAQ